MSRTVEIVKFESVKIENVKLL